MGLTTKKSAVASSDVSTWMGGVQRLLGSPCADHSVSRLFMSVERYWFTKAVGAHQEIASTQRRVKAMPSVTRQH